MLPLKACALLGQRAASFGELFEADRLGLVGIDQPLIGTSEPVEPCPDLLLGCERVLRLRTGASDEVLELRQQPLRVGEQPADMRPDGCLQVVAVDLRARAGDLACGHHAILAGAAIGAPDEAVAVRRATPCMARPQAPQVSRQRSRWLCFWLFLNDSRALSASCVCARSQSSWLMMGGTGIAIHCSRGRSRRQPLPV